MTVRIKKKIDLIDLDYLANKDPNASIPVSMNVVYARIAETTGNPNATKARAALINAANAAKVVQVYNGRKYISDPEFIPIKASELVNCFGQSKVYASDLNYHERVVDLA